MLTAALISLLFGFMLSVPWFWLCVVVVMNGGTDATDTRIMVGGAFAIVFFSSVLPAIFIITKLGV